MTWVDVMPPHRKGRGFAFLSLSHSCWGRGFHLNAYKSNPRLFESQLQNKHGISEGIEAITFDCRHFVKR